ncbi:MAG: NupC/NupG family nucleoside CNT transporter [Proteobacteria bacterium]|nr:MAG: NupC/NupG family nucleoside CNT transporter [Pseudomonadota bacterium]PIE17722.1 MAG: NupC/NupG family nucleoside CNT transporter [Pseudomonadota bacterium]
MLAFAGFTLFSPLLSRADDGSSSKPRVAKIAAKSAGQGARPATPPRGLNSGSRLKESAGGVARVQGLLGYLFVLLIAFALSNNREAIAWRPVAWGLALQALFAGIVLNPVVGRFFFNSVDKGVRSLLGFADKGIAFLFQSTSPHALGVPGPGGQMVQKTFIGQMSPALKSVAFSVLPTVIFFSALITLLYHLGVMQWIVKGIAKAMRHAMRTSGAETLSCTANIFVGQTEAPLLVKPFIGKMTQSELMAVMTGGFATVAGGVLAIYVGMLRGMPGIAGHLVTASIMAAPAALAVAKLMYPETEESVTAGAVQVNVERPDANAIEAVARGATEGMTLLLNICAMLIAFVGLMWMGNALLGVVGDILAWIGLSGAAGLSLQRLLGWLLSPLAFGLGVPFDEAAQVGRLLGEKLVLTELIAYLGLKSLVTGAGPAVLSARSAVICSYALCGFANIASIGIQIGGIGGMAPERRGDLARLGLRAMFAGALVSMLSGAVAGMLV